MRKQASFLYVEGLKIWRQDIKTRAIDSNIRLRQSKGQIEKAERTKPNKIFAYN